METYTAMRQFADSWALLAMFLFFIGVIIFVMRPGSRKIHDDIANIPLRDDDPERMKPRRDDADAKDADAKDAETRDSGAKDPDRGDADRDSPDAAPPGDDAPARAQPDRADPGRTGPRAADTAKER